jgi:phage gp45-like
MRGYTSGGSASQVSGANDKTGIQSFDGAMMINEARKAINAPQNFGFSSVVMNSIMSKAGSMIGSAETFISFMGGNRSFPVAGPMDDRRHRLMGLDQGDSGMFSTQGRKQQV